MALLNFIVDIKGRCPTLRRTAKTLNKDNSITLLFFVRLLRLIKSLLLNKKIHQKLMYKIGEESPHSSPKRIDSVNYLGE